MGIDFIAYDLVHKKVIYFVCCFSLHVKGSCHSWKNGFHQSQFFLFLWLVSSCLTIWTSKCNLAQLLQYISIDFNQLDWSNSEYDREKGIESICIAQVMTKHISILMPWVAQKTGHIFFTWMRIKWISHSFLLLIGSILLIESNHLWKCCIGGGTHFLPWAIVWKNGVASKNTDHY